MANQICPTCGSMYRFDGRKIRLAREEAEYLVDCLERERIPQWMMLAAEIRENWGMCTFEREQEVRALQQADHA